MSGIATAEQETTESSSEAETTVIDLQLIFNRIREKKKLFAIVLPIVFVLSCLHILNVPRYYTSSILLAPEIENPATGGGLSSIAASFGFDLSEMQTTDAITPLLYPDLMNDNKFVVDLFGIRVKTCDEAIDTTYYAYLTKFQEKSWAEPIHEFLFQKLLAPKQPSGKSVKSNDGNNPYILSRLDDAIVHRMRDDIGIDVDKKTGVISITAQAQDPLVCKTLADSVTKRLQNFITTYRTSKAQKDVDYYKHLMDDAQASYEQVRRQYAAFSDANTDVILASTKTELEDMENDMQLKYNQYTTYNTQYQAAIAKLRERTPAFTTLKGAEVPIRPAGPKRMVFVLGMLVLAFFAISVYATKDLIFKS